MLGMKQLDIARFEANLDPQRKPDECWLWLGTRFTQGYGYFRMSGKTGKAHRASYLLFVGEVPEGSHVLHRCDNRACVNPAHLFLGSNLDNMRDRDAKERGRCPGHARHPQTKLSYAKAQRIRELRRAGASASALASEFRVCRAHIYDVLNNKIWTE